MGKERGTSRQNPSSPLLESVSGSPGDAERLDVLEPDWITAVQQAVADWYPRNGRELPWRQQISPYRVLVSELMLVQTTVAAVIPYYTRFLQRFPDLQTLAAASDEDVLKAWEGLGYYRRARQLQAAARVIVREHGSEIPPDTQILQTLPGVGRYVAGAILSFAFDRPAPILEANTQRLLARLIGLDEELKRATSQRRLWDAAERLVPPQGAGAFNQALMDLGATICTPKSPACLICPLSKSCQARVLGRQNELPMLPQRQPPVRVVEACALVLNEGRVLMVQRGETGLWVRFWEFPTVNIEGANPAGRRRDGVTGLATEVERTTSIRAEIGQEVRKVMYSVTKHRVELRVFLASKLGGIPRPGDGFADARWMSFDELEQLTLSSPARKLAAWIRKHPGRLGSA